MKFYRVEDEVVFSDKELGVGTELVANTTDAAGEKHVPVVSADRALSTSIASDRACNLQNNGFQNRRQ